MSVWSIPFWILVYITGSTIKKEIKMERYLVGIQSSANIIKETTGTVFINCIGTERNRRMLSEQAELAANKMPITAARKKPSAILPKEEKTDIQNASVLINSNKACTVSSGEANNMLLRISMVANCQTSSQNIVMSTNHFFESVLVWDV